uniref:AMP-dependent synthetase and ligase n=1 Tax=Caulobacter sp. (strain K31) TaxID=366602 RepID=B0SXU2_CAUSK
MEHDQVSSDDSRDPIAIHAATEPDRLACVDLATDARLTYGQFDAWIDRCAAWLEGRLVAPRGERVAVLARNGVDVLAIQFACGRIGAIFVPLNWRLPGPELAVLVEDAAPRLLIHEREFDAALPALDRFGLDRVVRDETFAAQLTAAPARPTRTEPVAPDDPAILLYTSGTTGKPKGVMISPRNAWTSAANYAAAAKVGPEVVFLCDTPLFHTVGLIAISRTTLQVGGVLLMSPIFDPALTVRRLADPALGITHYFCVPQMAQMLRETPHYADADLSRLTALCTGGAPIAPAVIHRWLDEGVMIIDGYGMSEAGTVLGMPVGDLSTPRAKAGSAGVPAPGVRVRLVDRDGRDVPEGEVGEIWLKGANITSGYWNQPMATANAFEDGWLKTGDAARRDADGFYFLVDRWKDMFISGGENVYPAEIEAAILEMDAVSEVAVIGVPDPRWGEAGVAYVTPKSGMDLTPEAVLAHCRTRIAGYKTPRQVVLTADGLPRTGSGKVRKDILRAWWRATTSPTS